MKTNDYNFCFHLLTFFSLFTGKVTRVPPPPFPATHAHLVIGHFTGNSIRIPGRSIDSTFSSLSYSLHTLIHTFRYVIFSSAHHFLPSFPYFWVILQFCSSYLIPSLMPRPFPSCKSQPASVSLSSLVPPSLSAIMSHSRYSSIPFTLHPRLACVPSGK